MGDVGGDGLVEVGRPVLHDSSGGKSKITAIRSAHTPTVAATRGHRRHQGGPGATAIGPSVCVYGPSGCVCHVCMGQVDVCACSMDQVDMT